MIKTKTPLLNKLFIERADHPYYCGVVAIHHHGDHYCPVLWEVTFLKGSDKKAVEMYMPYPGCDITEYFNKTTLVTAGKNIIDAVVETVKG